MNLTIFVFILIALSAYTDLSYSFHTYEVDYWCKDVPINHMNKSLDYRCVTYDDPNTQCNQWDYNTTEFYKTINTEFDLVCNRDNYASLTQSFF
ncbi:unnamed protein product, partial [Medioppia subpectinata]